MPKSLKAVMRLVVDGLRYLTGQPSILDPLLLTFATITTVSPVIGLLAAIVHNGGSSVINLGLLAASSSLGAFMGAAFAGMRSTGIDATRSYALLGLFSAISLAMIVYFPVGLISMVPLAMLGTPAFAQAV